MKTNDTLTAAISTLRRGNPEGRAADKSLQIVKTRLRLIDDCPYECTCKVCGTKFKSNTPNADICVGCY
jgi:hypothetical protein